MTPQWLLLHKVFYQMTNRNTPAIKYRAVWALPARQLQRVNIKLHMLKFITCDRV